MSIKPYVVFVATKIETEEDLVENLVKLAEACGPTVIKQLRQWNKDHSLDDMEMVVLEDKVVNVLSLTSQYHCWNVQRDREKTDCHSCRNLMRYFIDQSEGEWRCSKGRRAFPIRACPDYSAIIQNRNGEPARSLEEIFEDVENKILSGIENKR